MDCARRAGAGASDGTKRLVRGPVRRPALGTWCPRAHSAPPSPMTTCRSGILRRRSALKLSGAASGCRSLGQCARWAPAVKDTDEPIYR